MDKVKAVVVPGNGGADVNDMWLPYVKKELEKLSIPTIAKNMPDPILARREHWLPFIENDLKADENTIGIGHSSGAVALMRYAETHKLKGLVLVGANYTDLGDEGEKASGYFDEPWNWEGIKQNSEFIIVFASTDDPYIPIEQPRFIQEKLEATYVEFQNKGHFMEITELPELIDEVQLALN